MSAYLYPIKIAVLIFPILALVLSLPVAIAQYRRYGSFIFWRGLVIYTFIFYLISAYFLIILPLPDRQWVAGLTTQKYNLVPLTAVREFLRTTVFSVSDPHSWLAAMKQPGFIQPAFNVVLTIPFGVYLRYYFKRPVWQVLLMSFGLSLFFELTQLSGLYGYYPRPYRLFDVDDLILNTSGGVIGAWLAPAMMRVFPSRDEMDQKSLARGQKVSFPRRLLAFFIDNAIMVPLLAGVLRFGLAVADVTVVGWLVVIVAQLLVLGLLPAVMHGQTIGKKVVRIRIVKEDGSAAGFFQILWRNFLLYGGVLQLTTGFLGLFNYMFGQVVSHVTDLNLALLAGLGAMLLFVTLNFLWEFVTRDNHYFYDVWAKTRQVSTIK